MENNSSNHISEPFNLELENIRVKLLAIGALVDNQLDDAIKVISSGNTEFARSIIKLDKIIDSKSVELDQECTRIIAIRQPVAFDLRLVITVMRVVNELEIIGNLAKSLATKAIQLSDSNETVSIFTELSGLNILVKDMLHRALSTFSEMNLENILSITRQNQNINIEYNEFSNKLISHTLEKSLNVQKILDILWIAKALERIGDHTCTICEYLIYMITGQTIRQYLNANQESK